MVCFGGADGKEVGSVLFWEASETKDQRYGDLKELLVHVERTADANLVAEDKSAFRMKHCYSAHGEARANQSSS